MRAGGCAVPWSDVLSGAAHQVWPKVTQSLFGEGAHGRLRDPSGPAPPKAPAHKSKSCVSQSSRDVTGVNREVGTGL